MISGQSMAPGLPAVSPNGTAPRCEHLDGLGPVRPRSADCRDCRDGRDGPDGRDRRTARRPRGLPDLRLGGLFR